MTVFAGCMQYRGVEQIFDVVSGDGQRSIALARHIVAVDHHACHGGCPRATAATRLVGNPLSAAKRVAEYCGMATTRRADMFTADGKPSDDDPRENGPTLSDERTTLVESLRCQRLTLEMKCAGLDAEAMARRHRPRLAAVEGRCRCVRCWSE